METNRSGFTQTFDEEVSGAVRAEMARARLAQATVAETIHMHPNVFGRKYRGESAFAPSELAAVAHLMGLSAADLTSEAERRFFARTAA